jgi:hypothetical protein
LFSRYERVTDRRSFKDRRDVWAIPKERKTYTDKEKPKATESVKKRASRKHVEETPADEQAEEEALAEEEAPAEEEEAPVEEEAPAEEEAAAEEEAPADEE